MVCLLSATGQVRNEATSNANVFTSLLSLVEFSVTLLGHLRVEQEQNFRRCIVKWDWRGRTSLSFLSFPSSSRLVFFSRPKFQAAIKRIFLLNFAGVGSIFVR